MWGRGRGREGGRSANAGRAWGRLRPSWRPRGGGLVPGQSHSDQCSCSRFSGKEDEYVAAGVTVPHPTEGLVSFDMGSGLGAVLSRCEASGKIGVSGGHGLAGRAKGQQPASPPHPHHIPLSLAQPRGRPRGTQALLGRSSQAETPLPVSSVLSAHPQCTGCAGGQGAPWGEPADGAGLGGREGRGEAGLLQGWRGMGLSSPPRNLCPQCMSAGAGSGERSEVSQL